MDASYRVKGGLESGPAPAGIVGARTLTQGPPRFDVAEMGFGSWSVAFYPISEPFTGNGFYCWGGGSEEHGSLDALQLQHPLDDGTEAFL
jgi:hypothetical protein